MKTCVHHGIRALEDLPWHEAVENAVYLALHDILHTMYWGRSSQHTKSEAIHQEKNRTPEPCTMSEQGHETHALDCVDE